MSVIIIFNNNYDFFIFTGAIRKAMSEDEMDDDDDPVDCHEDDILDDILHQNYAHHANHAHVAQSEYSFPMTNNSTIVHSTDHLHDRLQGLHVSDHPRTILERDPDHPAAVGGSPKPTVRVRRNSAGDETMLYCDFGDFNTQELISSPIEFEQGRPASSTVANNPENHPADFLAYSTQSESSHHQSVMLPRPIPTAHFNPGGSQNVPSTVPLAPMAVSGASSLNRNDNVLYQNMTFGQRQQLLQPGQVACPPLPLLAGSPLLGPPQLPPKSHIPPPYRPPPTQFIDGPAVLRSYEEEVHFHKGHLTHHGTTPMSSSDGGSHDSHNDSGYCVRLSGVPSPSLSGKVYIY